MLPPAKRATITKAIQRCIEIAKIQDKTLKTAFPYAKLLCDNERELGRQIPREFPHGGDRKSRSQFATLKDIGITKSRSSRAQQMAGVPKNEYNKWIVSLESSSKIKLPTLDALYQLFRPGSSTDDDEPGPDRGQNIYTGQWQDHRDKVEFNSVELILSDPWAHPVGGVAPRA